MNLWPFDPVAPPLGLACQDIFSRFLIPRHVSETIDDHIRTISSPQSWATQVKVAAAASVFQVPVYYCSKIKDSYKWNVVKPFFSHQCTLKLPALPQPDDSITRLDSIPLLRTQKLPFIFCELE